MRRVGANRERAYVRRLQLAAFRLYGSTSLQQALLSRRRMRRNDEPIDAATRREVFRIYESAFNDDEAVRHVVDALPPLEHAATIRALFSDSNVEASRAPLRDAMLALLLVAAAQPTDALAMWRAALAALPPDGDGRVADRANAAIDRLSRPARPTRTRG